MDQKGHCRQKCYNLLHNMTMTLCICINMWPFTYVMGSRVNLGPFAVKGVIFTKKFITRSCYIAWPWDSCMCIGLRPSTHVLGQRSTWGHLGAKSYFCWKYYNLSILHCMAKRLIHVLELETLSLCNYMVICVNCHKYF